VWTSPLTEEITLQLFGCEDLPYFRVDHLSDGDPTYSPENSFKIVGTPVGDSREKMFDVYGDSRENLLDVLVVVNILNL